MYLTYDEYLEFGGDTIDETVFENLEFEARSQIDYWTFNRLVAEENLPEAVKRCMFKLIELLQDQQTIIQASIPTDDGTTNAGIMSQSNDGVSVSYNTLSARQIVTSLDDSIQTAINRYLGNVRNSLGQKVLYRGIYPNE